MTTPATPGALVKYVPGLNGTAFIGMIPNTGLNAGKDYPYYLAADVDRALEDVMDTLSKAIPFVDHSGLYDRDVVVMKMTRLLATLKGRTA